MAYPSSPLRSKSPASLPHSYSFQYPPPEGCESVATMVSLGEICELGGRRGWRSGSGMMRPPGAAAGKAPCRTWSRSSYWVSSWEKSRFVKLLGCDRIFSWKREPSAGEPVHLRYFLRILRKATTWALTKRCRNLMSSPHESRLCSCLANRWRLLKDMRSAPEVAQRRMRRCIWFERCSGPCCQPIEPIEGWRIGRSTTPQGIITYAVGGLSRRPCSRRTCRPGHAAGTAPRRSHPRTS